MTADDAISAGYAVWAALSLLPIARVYPCETERGYGWRVCVNVLPRKDADVERALKRTGYDVLAIGREWECDTLVIAPTQDKDATQELRRVG